jgi:pyrimidine deaminase RibD-like protein
MDTDDAGLRLSPGDHVAYMKYALSLARKSPPKPTNYRVGALLIDPQTNAIVSTGYTLELPGNTHAEQCCFAKLAESFSVAEDQLETVIQGPLELYTTMEPCSVRLSGNLPCTDRILKHRSIVRTVYVGVQEPEKFVHENNGRRALENASVAVIHVAGLEKEILEVATAGHVVES